MFSIKIKHQLNLIKLFKEIKLKKQYIKQLKNKVLLLNMLKKKKINIFSSKLFFENTFKKFYKEDFLITYIICVAFFKTNTFLQVMDSFGNLKFFCSAGSLNYKGKSKKFRSIILKSMYKILISKLKFLKNHSVSLHLKNVGFSKGWVVKLFRKKIFIKVVRSFNRYPYNGCRKRKV